VQDFTAPTLSSNPGEGVGQRIFTGHEYDSDSSGLTPIGKPPALARIGEAMLGRLKKL